jgi:hypothetical protein
LAASVFQKLQEEYCYNGYKALPIEESKVDLTSFKEAEMLKCSYYKGTYSNTTKTVIRLNYDNIFLIELNMYINYYNNGNNSTNSFIIYSSPFLFPDHKHQDCSSYLTVYHS